MINQLEKYILDIENSKKLSEEKKEYYKLIAKRLDKNGFPIILNSYHLSSKDQDGNMYLGGNDGGYFKEYMDQSEIYDLLS